MTLLKLRMHDVYEPPHEYGRHSKRGTRVTLAEAGHIVDAYRRGVSVKDIASTFRRADTVVRKYLRRAGVLTLVALALWTPPMQAAGWKKWFCRSVAVGGVALDMWTTQRAINRGGIELNPVLRGSALRRNGLILGMSGGVILMNELLRPVSPTLANMDELGLGTLHAVVGVHNLKVEGRRD
jgi:hypothetical protein